jgi:thymidylate synthase (FAD)
METKIVVTMNVRELLHFFELRCCKRAQWEIRALALVMLDLVLSTAPYLFMDAGASCRRGPCREGKMTCGDPYPKAPKRD